MKIALAQIRSQPGEVAANVRTMVAQVRAAAGRRCDVVVLPEMSDTGYHMPTILRTASTWERGPLTEIAGAAAEMRLTVVVGLSERVGGDIYNSTAVVGPSGDLLAKYRKTHLVTTATIREHEYLRPGDTLVLCDIAGFKVGLMTCYDIRFPEVARRLALRGAEMLIVPAAWPRVRIQHWQTINACRAIENQVYVAAVNRVGTDEGLLFGGTSQIIDPYGALLDSGSETEEELLVGEVSKERLVEVRSLLHVYADRREELY